MGQIGSTYPIQGARLLSAFRGDFNDIIDALLTTSVGSSEPTTTYACMLWADTNQGVLKQRNPANTAWVVRGTLETDYGGALPLSGGTMTGAIDMDGNAITDLPAGSGNAPARYADLAAYVKADGSIAFTGFPDLPSGSPSTDYEAAHKKYVDDTSVAGGSFTGQITMTVAPTADNHVMRKTDTDNMRDTHTHGGGVGEGEKIEGDNLKATGEADGSFLRVSSALAQWESVAPVELVMREEPKEVLSISNQQTVWTDFDFGADIAADSSAVYVKVWTDGRGTFHFRPDGSSVTTGFTTEPLAFGENANLRMWLPVVSRVLEYKLLKISETPAGKIHLLGYMRKFT